MAIGGGTPTYLDPADLNHLFTFLEQIFGCAIAHLPASIETSPATATSEKIALLKERGFSRVSIGIQSFIPAELQHIGRPQSSQEVHQALERLQKANFPTLNLDLIYGCPGQTVQSWLYSLTEALRYEPEELYLYPLYVRPLTGMDKMAQSWDDQRQELYHTGREFLLAHGYEQRSMRFFRKMNHTAPAASQYCCQEDGMIGLGCGARSYTRSLHYATEYAVGRPGIKAILQDWIARPDSAFAVADYGFVLNQEEQKRRYLLKSLLNTTGLDTQAYAHFFGSAPEHDFPQFTDLVEMGWAEQTAGWWGLTPAGLAWSDAIGHAFYSPAVLHHMNLYQLQ
jgi:oxygen-independent coproporphyrinogen-3 oxidase